MFVEVVLVQLKYGHSEVSELKKFGKFRFKHGKRRSGAWELSKFRSGSAVRRASGAGTDMSILYLYHAPQNA